MSNKVAFLDLRVEDEKMRHDILSSIDTVLRHGRIVEGPEVSELEKRVAAYCDSKYAVGVGSGTDALFLCMKSLGIGAGDEVITTPLSWIATANAIALTGATPVFADICDDLNIDPESVRRLITPQTKAILPVHFTGKVCKMKELMQIGKDDGVMVVEDVAQAFGARYLNRKAGSFGVAGCFSMNPMKIFGACGNAGMITTNREDIYDSLLALRHNGMVNRVECREVSLNGRIDTFQAAILLRKLDYFEQIIQKRRKVASWYDELLKGIVSTPVEAAEEFDIYYTYTVRASKRDELKDFLELKGIETQIQHPRLIPQQPAYRNMARGEFMNAERLVKQVLSLPANEKINREDVTYVAGCIKKFYKRML